MVKLTYVDLPESTRSGASWQNYTDVVTEFYQSGRPSALIEEDGVKPATLGQRVSNALFHMDDVRAKCKVITRKGRPYIIRTDMGVEL